MSGETGVPLASPDFQRLQLDKRVSQALNGDLYFSNVLPEDTRTDYICYARFPHTQTIQQKQPISVTVLESKSTSDTLSAAVLLNSKSPQLFHELLEIYLIFTMADDKCHSGVLSILTKIK